MDNQKIRIKDIAEALHLSVSTVSKALNGAFDISRETKEEVLEYAKKNGYKARDERLVVKKVRRLCVLYDNIDYSTQCNVIIPVSMSFANFARNNNFEIVQTPISSMRMSYDEFMAKNDYVGAFIAGLNYKSSIIHEIQNTSYPTVLFDNNIEGNKISTISIENVNSIVKIVDLLYSLGHRKIGFIHGDKHSFISNERFAGYIIGQNIHDLEYNPNYVYYGEYSEQSGYDAGEFFAGSDVTAVICSSDLIAIGLIRGLEEKGISVPDDISVTGFDDLDVAKYVNPSLTTVKQNIDKIGEKAFNLLLNMLTNRSGQRIVVTSDIIVRNSTAKVKE